MAGSVQIEFPDAFKRWQAAPQEFRDKLQDRFRTYISYLVQYVKREKLSGQVLGKYQSGAVSLLGGKAMYAQGNPRWAPKPPGTLKKTFGAQVYNGLEAQFFETVYGRAWEGGPNGEGWTRKAYTVSAKHLTRDGGFGRLAFFAGGKWRFPHEVHIPMMSFPAKPHIRPSIRETVDRLQTLVLRPLARFLAGKG
jgi:hypothetical protein